VDARRRVRRSAGVGGWPAGTRRDHRAASVGSLTSSRSPGRLRRSRVAPRRHDARSGPERPATRTPAGETGRTVRISSDEEWGLGADGPDCRVEGTFQRSRIPAPIERRY
jgi:hypothetical protein